MTRFVLLAVAAAPLLAAGPAQAFTAYVSNEKGNTVSVVDLDTMAVTQTIKVGQRPRGITLGNDGKVLYVCTSDDDHIEMIDTDTLKPLGTLPSGPDPVGVEPEGMGVSPDGKWLVNTSETTNMAHFIDTATLQVTDNVLVDTRPRFAQFTPDGSQVWVSAEIGGTVSVIDTATRQVLKKIGFAVQGVRKETIQPVGVRITADGKTAFVALGPANRVAVIDTATYEVTDYLLVGQRVWQLAFTPDGKYLVSTNGASNDISVIDVAARKVIKSIPVGELPWGVAIR
jgi:YVTN family beta-propeller protein